ncbi:MAG: N-acetylglucosamine-6-phosphate deacetylase [Rhodospirillaceae bacterium]|nr:N-acetylglucosamine-6-phosphate deacetylase [Rhodospirillaceae bacterium]
MFALTNCRIFTSFDCLEDHAVLIDGKRIAGIVADQELSSEIRQLDLEGGYLAPGFIDIQVNGGGGVMFNDHPNVESIARIGDAHRQFGTVGFLPTLISGSRETVGEAIKAVEEGLVSGVPGLLGLHLEGPAINPARRGMHPQTRIGSLSEAEIAGLVGLPALRIVTLAPECAPPGLIAELNTAGVKVLGGHTEATAEEIANAKVEGLCGVTHLFNAMSGFSGRAPGTIGAALSDDDLWCSIIADGVHVHVASIRAAWYAKRKKLLLVTDAMAPVGAEITEFEQDGHRIIVRDNSCYLADGRLAGSTLEMSSAVRHCVSSVELPLDEALRMASTYPAAFLGLSTKLGQIKTGYDASLVWLDNGLEVKAVWIEGEEWLYD